MKQFAIIFSLSAMLMLPLSFYEGEPSFTQAHAVVGKLVLWAAKHEAKAMVKNWLKDVAKAEGKRVALAAIKSLKALPNDQLFRRSVVAALAGGNYAQATAFAKARSVSLMKAGARDQWQADNRRLSEHPELMFQSFARSAGDTVEGQWNSVDDVVTCGRNNVDIQLQALNPSRPGGERHYTIADSPNDNLLTGRALLQRAMFKSMLRNSAYRSPQQARAASSFYAHLACVGGKSRKVTAFIGGIALHGKGALTRLKDVRGKSLQFMGKMNRWAEKKL